MDFSKYEADIIKDTIDLINIPSFYSRGSRSKGKPFGETLDTCLDETLKICRSLGFRTYKESDGYYGYAEVGEGEDYIALLCHLDVVPEGNLSKWETPPYDAKVKDGVIYGRGASDDKGPTVVSIYAVKAILDSKIHLKKRIRLIFGLDEETQWRGMAIYQKKEKNPICAIAADGVFPFAFAEKGILQLELNRKTKEEDIMINGGANYNSVAMEAIYQGTLKEKINAKIEPEMSVEQMDDGIKVIGKPAHGAVPFLGKNAILYLAKILKDLGKADDIIEVLTSLFNFHYEQATLFDKGIEDESGKITVNLGAIEMDEKNTKLKVDIRVPVTFTKDEIMKIIKDKVDKYDFTIEIFSYLSPLYAPLDSEFSKILFKTYQKHTNDYETKPYSSGGGTYARIFPKNSVCFGPQLKGASNHAHEANERVGIDSLMKALEIYYDTLLELNQSDSL